MKKVLIYPICFISTCAIAKTTFYYETGGQCPVNTGLFLNPNATSCSEAVTKVTTPTASGRSFAGFWVGGTQVIDSNGNILVNSSTAPNLFDSSAETYNASAVYTGTNTITVRESNYWVAGDKYIGWYTCADFGYHMCQTGGAYVAPPAPAEGLCHSYGVNPNPNRYDYKFNSWVLGANHNTFVPASCYNGLSETCPRQDGCWCNHYSNGEIASGNSSKPGACTESMLGPLEAVKGKFSLQNVYPFACKRFYVNGTWTDEVDVENGSIILDNSTPGKCRYRLICNEGYHAGSNGSDGHSCESVACRGFFNGNYQELITAPCVQDTPTTCPTMQNPDNGSISQPTPNNGQCSYTVLCADLQNDYGYACDETTGLCSKSCTIGSDCNNLQSQYTGAQQQLCKRCPTVNELNISSQLSSVHTTLELSEYDYSNKKCKYNVSCNEGYNGSIETIDCNLSNGNCNGTTLLNLISNHQCSLACPTVEQLGIGDYLADRHIVATALGPSSSGSMCGYRFTRTEGCVCNFNSEDFYCHGSSGSFPCNREYFMSRLNALPMHCTCASDCPDVYAEDGLNLGATLAGLNMDGEFDDFNLDSCTYNFSCLTPYTNDLNHITCAPSDTTCSQTYFSNILTQHACTFECPSVASLNLDDELAAHHATLSGPTIVNDYTCDYQLSCNNGYSGSNSQTIGCVGLACKRQTFLNHINNFECNYSCPSMPNIVHGSISTQDQTVPCHYNVTCDNDQSMHGYSCRDDLGLCNNSCSTVQECYELAERYRELDRYSGHTGGVCQWCPGLSGSSGGLDIWHESQNLHIHGEIESFTVDETHSTCTYKFYCENNPNNIRRVSCSLNQGDCTREHVWVSGMNSGSYLNCD